jgi:hypothetical protein
MFDRACFSGRIKGLWSIITGQSRQIPILTDLLAQIDSPDFRDIGRRSVRLANITGTQNSANFDCEFYPLYRHLKDRWVSVASAMLRSAFILPPIEAVKVGEQYYVADGHHRVSVAKRLDILYIDGHVTVWEPAGEAPRLALTT